MKRFVCLMILSTTLIFFSCSTSKRVVGKGIIQKRKYLKGFYLDIYNQKETKTQMTYNQKLNRFSINNQTTNEQTYINDNDIENNYSVDEEVADYKLICSANNKSEWLIKKQLITTKRIEDQNKINLLKNKTKIKNPKDEPKNNPKVIWGWGLSIVGFFIAGLILGIISIILCSIGLKEIKQNPDKWTGKNYAIAGIIMGIIDIIGWIIIILILLG